MNYICHTRYSKTGASGKKYVFKRKKCFDTIGRFITYNNEAVCSTTSDDAYRHFARNDDGQGLLRGELTTEIAFSERHPNKEDGFRFTLQQRNLLREEYSHFLQDNEDVILFGYDFFNADIDELQKLKNRLEILECTQS